MQQLSRKQIEPKLCACLVLCWFQAVCFSGDSRSLAVDGGVSESEDEEDDEADHPAPSKASESDQQASSKDPLKAGQYHDRHSSGAPKPLVPCMVTLSMLPRSQWQNLVHLDAIKASSRTQLELLKGFQSTRWRQCEVALYFAIGRYAWAV